MTARVPPPLDERVDQHAARMRCSKDWIISQALAAWIDQEEQRCFMSREALADLEAGSVIDHQTVKAWADSLSSFSPPRSPGG